MAATAGSRRSSVLGTPTVRPYTDADREAWDDFVRMAEGSHPAQLSAWVALTEATYGIARRAWLAVDDDGVRGILPLFLKRRFGRAPVLFSSPGGLVARDADAAATLLGAARETLAREAAAYVELRDQRARWPDLATSDEHWTHELRLEADAAAQWRAFDAKLRNQIRKAERGGYSVYWGPRHVDAFCRVMLENMRDLGTPMRAASWFQRALDALGERALLLVIVREAEPVGAMFLAVHGERVFDLWASSLRRHFAHCPNQMLYWEAIQEAIRRGLRVFDFGRSQRDTGTFRFKAQWGAQAIPLHYQYVLGAGGAMPSFAQQQDRMDLAVRMWKHLPLPVARLLGEPIRRRFPELL